MSRHRRIGLVCGIGAAVAIVAAGPGGCASSPAVSAGRPTVPATVLDAVGGDVAAADSASLEFFDGLADRRLVCHDDVLHAALLLGNGRSAPTFADRVALARHLGYLAGSPMTASTTNPRQAATIGEVARIMVQMSPQATTPAAEAGLTQQQALSTAAGRGWMPPGAKPYQGLTGAQLISVLSAVRTAMGDRPRNNLDIADLRSPAAAPVQPNIASQAPTASEAKLTRPSSAVASAEGDGAGRAEPLPPEATHPAIEAPPPASPARPPTAESVRPRPREWVPGRPLRKPDGASQ